MALHGHLESPAPRTWEPRGLEALIPTRVQITGCITNAQLKANPFFKPFTRLKLHNGGAVVDATNGIDIAGSQGSTHASNYAIRAWLLAYDVPAISQPAGSSNVSNIAGIDMNDDLRSGTWGNWKHSDIKNQKMDNVYQLYADIVNKGNFRK